MQDRMGGPDLIIEALYILKPEVRGSRDWKHEEELAQMTVSIAGFESEGGYVTRNVSGP